MSSDTDCATTVGSLFSGIGGIDLGLERAGMVVIWQAEIDPYASRVLAEHWPDVPNLGDVTTIDWSTVERPDLICGGFPCQPVSYGGLQQAEADHRWLWPEFARCLRALRPRWVLIENVPGLLTAASGGAAQAVLGTLSEYGYDAEWASIPAAAVGAPHLRYRVFIIANTNSERLPGRSQRHVEQGEPGLEASLRGDAGGLRDAVAGEVGQRGRPWFFGEDARPGCEDGHWWESEPDVGRTLDGVPHKVDRLRCLGNAVVPQVAEYVGRRLLAHLAAEGPPTA